VYLSIKKVSDLSNKDDDLAYCNWILSHKCIYRHIFFDCNIFLGPRFDQKIGLKHDQERPGQEYLKPLCLYKEKHAKDSGRSEWCA
jgi:hypothetical protein